MKYDARTRRESARAEQWAPGSPAGHMPYAMCRVCGTYVCVCLRMCALKIIIIAPTILCSKNAAKHCCSCGQQLLLSQALSLAMLLLAMLLLMLLLRPFHFNAY